MNDSKIYDALSLILHTLYCAVWFVIADSPVPILDNHVNESKTQKKDVAFSKSTTRRGDVPTQKWDAVSSHTDTCGRELVRFLGFSKTAAPW